MVDVLVLCLVIPKVRKFVKSDRWGADANFSSLGWCWDAAAESGNLDLPELETNEFRAALQLVMNRWQFILRMHEDQELSTGPFSWRSGLSTSDDSHAAPVEQWDQFQFRVSLAALAAGIPAGSTQSKREHYSPKALGGSYKALEKKGLIFKSYSSSGAYDQRIIFEITPISDLADHLEEVMGLETAASFAEGRACLFEAMASFDNPWSAKEIQVLAVLAYLDDLQKVAESETTWTNSDLVDLTGVSRNIFHAAIVAKAIRFKEESRAGHRNSIKLFSYQLPSPITKNGRTVTNPGDFAIDGPRVQPLIEKDNGTFIETPGLGGGNTYLAGNIS